MELVPTSGKAFHEMLEHCFHSATRVLVRLGTDVGRLGLARSRRSNSSQRCYMELRSGLCACQSSSFTQILTRLLFLHQSLQMALCIGAGNVLLASTKHRFVDRTARGSSVIYHPRTRASTALESNGGKLYTTPADVWHCAW